MSQTQSYRGMADVTSTESDYSALNFMIKSEIAKIATVAIVRVVGIKNNGAVSQVGYVDLQPMVAQIDGNGQPTPHGRIFQAPFFRTQGGQDGKDAVIIDPAVGDIGIAVFCSRDSANVTSSREDNPPASRRRYDMSDALYIGGILNQAPTQWLRFHDDEIELFAREDIVVHAKGRDLRIETGRNMDGEIASNVTLKVGNRVEIEVGATINIKAGGTVIVDAPTAHFTGNVNVDGDVRAGTVSLRTHVHSGVMTGPGTSGPPVGG